MFGFSLAKLLVLALIIGAVIVGFRLFGRLSNPSGRVSDENASETRAFDTEYDPETETYVVRDDETKRG
ncbi:MAG: hypothetical protein CMM26_00895 [Rhodospirillaceae bacterium]|nr:hypothetical protein [Rhodospirillaceae bacterium]|tara:strand:- start:1193 stop:1399 length:207 start_codon:yes stop_codon:yes gene_type:complete